MALLLLTVTLVLALLRTRPTTPFPGLTILLTPLIGMEAATTCGVNLSTLVGLLTYLPTILRTAVWVLPVRRKVVVRTLVGTLLSPALSRRVATNLEALVIPKLTLLKVLLVFRTLARAPKTRPLLMLLDMRFTVTLVIGVPSGMLVVKRSSAEVYMEFTEAELPELTVLEIRWTVQGNLLWSGSIGMRVPLVRVLRLTLWCPGELMWLALLAEHGGTLQPRTQCPDRGLDSVLTRRLTPSTPRAAMFRTRALLCRNRVELRM